MEIKHKVLPKSRVEVTVSLDKPEVADFFAAGLERLASKTKLPGFRAGKVPSELIKAQLSPEEVRDEAVTVAVAKAWHQVAHYLEEQKEKTLPIEDPAVEVKQFSQDGAGELVFGFDVRPAVKLGDWQKIKLTKQKEEKVKDEAVTDLLTRLQKTHAQKVVSLEAAKTGDEVLATFTGSIRGKEVAQLSAKDFAVELGSKLTIPGFDTELVGLRKGESKEFEVDFPKDHFDKNLAGQKVKFTVTINEIYKLNLPEIDETFAKNLGVGSADELKAAVREDLERQQESEQKSQRQAEWLSKFADLVKADLPDALIKAEVDKRRADWREFLLRNNLQEDKWLADRQTTMEEMDKGFTEAAEQTVKIGLGLSEVAIAQKKSLVSNEDFQGLVEELVAKAGA